MPNRIIRESCRTSPTLAQLSHGAERMFWRLTTVADDYGRFEADPMVLLASCFAKMLNLVKLLEVSKWLAEMVSCQLVTTYASNGKQYGFFNTWDKYQLKRAKSSKYPPPTDDSICEQMSPRSEKREARSETLSRTGGAHANGFDTFWASYPRKKSKGQAERAWAKLQPDEQLQGTILSALERAKTSAEWRDREAKYLQHPATWLNAKGWEDEIPPAVPSPTSAMVDCATCGYAHPKGRPCET